MSKRAVLTCVFESWCLIFVWHSPMKFIRKNTNIVFTMNFSLKMFDVSTLCSYGQFIRNFILMYTFVTQDPYKKITHIVFISEFFYRTVIQSKFRIFLGSFFEEHLQNPSLLLSFLNYCLSLFPNPNISIVQMFFTFEES